MDLRQITPICAVLLVSATPHCTLSTHEKASFTKLASGSWRVQVRHKGRYVSESFQRREDARRWATDMEDRIDRGELPTSARARGIATFGDLVDLHIADMCEVAKAPGRSKDATLAMLKRELGKLRRPSSTAT